MGVVVENGGQADVAATDLDVNEVRLQALVLCDYFNSTEDGKANVMGIFDQMLVQETLPQPSPRFVLYVRTAGRVREPIIITINAPSGKSLARIELSAPGGMMNEDGTDPVFLQGGIPIGNLNIEESGVYWVVARIGDRALGALPVQISQREANDDGTNPDLP